MNNDLRTTREHRSNRSANVRLPRMLNMTCTTHHTTINNTHAMNTGAPRRRTWFRRRCTARSRATACCLRSAEQHSHTTLRSRQHKHRTHPRGARRSRRCRWPARGTRPRARCCTQPSAYATTRQQDNNTIINNQGLTAGACWPRRPARASSDKTPPRT